MGYVIWRARPCGETTPGWLLPQVGRRVRNQSNSLSSVETAEGQATLNYEYEEQANHVNSFS